MPECTFCAKSITGRTFTSRKALLGGMIFCKAKCMKSQEALAKTQRSTQVAVVERKEREAVGRASLVLHGQYRKHMTEGEIKNGSGATSAHTGLHVITDSCRNYIFDYDGEATDVNYRANNCFSASVQISARRNAKSSTFFPEGVGLIKIEELLRDVWGEIHANAENTPSKYISVAIPDSYLQLLKPAKKIEVWLQNKKVKSVYPILE